MAQAQSLERDRAASCRRIQNRDTGWCQSGIIGERPVIAVKIFRSPFELAANYSFDSFQPGKLDAGIHMSRISHDTSHREIFLYSRPRLREGTGLFVPAHQHWICCKRWILLKKL